MSLVDANGIIQIVTANLSIAFFNERELGPPDKPIEERAKNIYEAHFQAQANLNQITFDIERYEIALPEVKTVRLAFFEKAEELNKKYNNFFIEVLKFIPHDVPDNEQATIGKTVTGHKITIDDIERLKGLAQNYSECTEELHAYISDLQVILQNSLLGHLFDRELPHRRKPGSSLPLLKTDDTAAMKKLKTQLLLTGVWGKILTRRAK